VKTIHTSGRESTDQITNPKQKNPTMKNCIPSERKPSLDVARNWTIAAIKEELQQRERIAVIQQRLLYRGQNLPDQTTIEVSHIQPSEILHIVLSLRAGGH
jgi:hypothetical protein